jgi:hypothetical protein
VQSGGSKSANVVTAFTGLTGPLLWIVALPLTVNGSPALAEAGEEAVAAVTFTSAVAKTAVVPVLLVIELLLPFESTTWS